MLALEAHAPLCGTVSIDMFDIQNVYRIGRISMKANASTCRGFALAGLICAAVSLLMGGALLSALGILLAWYGYANSKKLLKANPQDLQAAIAFKLARNAIIFGAIAAGLNLITAVFLFPSMMSGVSASSTPAF